MEHSINEDEAKRIIDEKEKTSLGKANSLIQNPEPTHLVHDLGWLRIKPELLPSQGIFYPENSEITIRAASAAEIRHWSTIDEDDILSMDDGLNKIVEKCCKIKLGGQLSSYKDLKEIDRFYLVFAIREATFKNGENQLDVICNCKNCGHIDKPAIIKEMLSYYTPVDELASRFDNNEKCFVLKLTNGEQLHLQMPTLGVMNFIKSYVRGKNESNQEYDKAFIKWAPFIFDNWRTLNDATYAKKLQDSYAWGTDTISVLEWFVKQMQGTINAEIKNYCTVCGEETAVPISFRGGIKTLFLISDISSKLL